MCVQLHATQLTVFRQRWRLSNFCKMSLWSLHLPPSLCTSTAQIKKKTVMEVPPSTSIKTDTWDIYVTFSLSCQPLAKRLNNKSWTVHPNIAIRREGHRKIQVRDLYLVQMMSQCRATSRKSRHRSLHVAIPNVAGDTSRATCRLSRLTEHIQRNTCVANNVAVAVACRVSRVARNWTQLKAGFILHARVYVRIRRLSAQLFILLSPVAPSAYARIRRLSPSKFKHVELSRPAQTSAGIPANHESAARSPRADALFCIGTYADVYRRIRSPVYTFIHGATCAMQWRRAGSRKRGHLRRLPAHTRAWSINPALRLRIIVCNLSKWRFVIIQL